jgi:membrane protein/epoxyqueuosine reductase
MTSSIQPTSAAGSGFSFSNFVLFFQRMWPSIYDLSTSESYVYASAIAFNALLSFYAFLILIGNVLVNWMGWQEGYETIYRLMIAIAPTEAASAIISLDKATRSLGKGTGWFSMLALIFTSSGVFLPLEIALNRAWGIRESRGTIQQQLVYMPLVLACGGVIVLFVGMANVWNQVLNKLVPVQMLNQLLFNSISALLSVPCVTLIFFLLYYFLPNGQVRWRRVFFTSAAMAVLWVVMTFAYRLLLPLLNFKSRYESLFGIVTIITWVFLSSFILILGANLSAREILPREPNNQASS